MKGSLQERNNKYYAVFRVNGKQKWVNLNIPTIKGNKRRAESALRKVLDEYTANENLRDDMYLTDYLTLWLEETQQLVKPSTWEGYHKVVNGKINPYFYERKYKLRDLKGMHLTQYFIHLKEKGKSNDCGGLSKKSILNIRGVLSSAFQYAVDNDLMSENVVEKSRLPLFENEEKFEPTIYNTEQIKILLDYAEKTKSNACLFLFLEVCSGARKGELLALTWDSVDFQNNTIHICLNRTGSRKEILKKLTSTKTINSIRTIHLPQKVMNMLKEEKMKQELNRQLLGEFYHEYEYDYIIRKADGSVYNPNSINRIIKKMTQKLNLPHCRIHDYRHMVASILFNEGASLSDVTIQLGHGQTSTTERIYIHRKNIASVSNMRALSDAIGI